MSLFHQEPKRAGAGKSRDAPTGKGPRVGNTPHTDTGDNTGFPQRHRSANKKVEINSDNLDVREGGKKANGK